MWYMNGDSLNAIGVVLVLLYVFYAIAFTPKNPNLHDFFMTMLGLKKYEERQNNNKRSKLCLI